MNEHQQHHLMKKLAEMQSYLDSQISAKRDMSRGYSSVINDTRKRITAFAEAIKTENNEVLEEIMFEVEFADYLRLV